MDQDPALEDYEAIVSHLPSHAGDGYSYGGGVILSIGPYALDIGGRRDLAEEIAARWNAGRGKVARPNPDPTPFQENPHA